MIISRVIGLVFSLCHYYFDRLYTNCRAWGLLPPLAAQINPILRFPLFRENRFALSRNKSAIHLFPLIFADLFACAFFVRFLMNCRFYFIPLTSVDNYNLIILRAWHLLRLRANGALPQTPQGDSSPLDPSPARAGAGPGIMPSLCALHIFYLISLIFLSFFKEDSYEICRRLLAQ